MAYEREHEREYQTREEFSQLSSILAKGGTRALVCFCVDVSETMTYILHGQDHKIDKRRSGATSTVEGQVANVVYALPGYTLENRLSKLNDILKSMLRRMQKNPNLRDNAVISIVTFAEDADMKYSFLDVALLDPNKYGEMSIARRAKQTSAGKALQLALQEIEYAQSSFGDADVDLRTPTIIFLSDGEPTDNSRHDADIVNIGGHSVSNDATSMAAEICRRVRENELNMVPVLIGEGNAQADSFMRSLTPERTYRRMNTERDYEEVFEMIEQTLAQRFMQLVVDQNAHMEASVQLEARDAEKVTDTNSTGVKELSDSDMASIFSGGAGNAFGGALAAEVEDDFLL